MLPTTVGRSQQGGTGQTTDWALWVPRTPRPADVPSSAEVVRLDELVARCGVDFGRDRFADREDWAEMAYRLDAAVRAVGAEHVWIRAYGDLGYRNAVTGQPWTGDPDALPVWGPIPKLGRLGFTQTVALDAAPDRYASTSTFLRHAGRRFELCPGDLQAVEAAVAACDCGAGTVVKVVAKAKAGIWLLPPGGRDAEAWQEVALSCLQFEERPGVFCVQERIEMRHEYRAFAVDGKVVTAAGCVEDLTPLDNDGQQFDLRTQQLRNTSRTARRGTAVNDLLPFARSCARSLSAEGIPHAAIDVALSLGGPVMVEANGLLNSGLYASQPWRIAAALARSPNPMLPTTVGGFRSTTGTGQA